MENKHSSCCGGDNCCKIDSIITVGERGQTVLPKEIREKVGIKAGDKLAVISWCSENHGCCISLVKVDEMSDMVKKMLGPMVDELKK